MPEEGEAQEGEGDTAKLLNLAHMGVTMVIGMLGATVKIGNFIPRAVAGTPTRNIWHLPFGRTFVLPPMNKGHAFMGMNWQATKGFGYEHSQFQNPDLHRLQHRYDNYGRYNKKGAIKFK